MTTTTLSGGGRQVVIMEHTGGLLGTAGYVKSWFSARLYVANGEVATLQSWKGKTMAGARRWAAKVLAA